MRSMTDRLARLEARLLPLTGDRLLPPALVSYVQADGTPCDHPTVHLLSGWPLAVARVWNREPTEAHAEFIDRVMREAPPGALLVEIGP